jgi:molecular chaperone GrpE (heat shock protein)
MSLQRIERALRQHGLEVVRTTGERRGYLRNGRVFRYAQVRVAKG